MTETVPQPDAAQDERHLRRAIALSRSALDNGCGPFGALLVDASGNVVAEAENTVARTQDATAHAERLLITEVSIRCTDEQRAGATLYSSAEPCAMCAGAIFWAGIGRLVFGIGVERLRELTCDPPDQPTLDMPCRAVFATGQRKIDVAGPMLEEEAAGPHIDFMQAKRG